MNIIPMERRVRIISCIVDGVSLSATARLTNTHPDTVGRLALLVGEGCYRLHDRMFRDLQVSLIQLDEQWSFVFKKERRRKETDPCEYGDAWSFIALDVPHRAIISYLVGKRDGDNTEAFVDDLRQRVLGRPTIASDGWVPYIEAIERAFGAEVDYGQLVKQYDGDRNDPASQRHYVRYKGAEKVRVVGSPELRDISTSYIERSNLSARMSLRRFTRKCNGFSKKLRNHCAAVALWVAFYNLCRVHETLRITPAMALGVTDHVWPVQELIEAALAQGLPTAPRVAPPDDPLPQTSRWHGVPADRIPHDYGMGKTKRPKLVLIPGGRR